MKNIWYTFSPIGRFLIGFLIGFTLAAIFDFIIELVGT